MENQELDLNLAEAVVKQALAAGADEAEVYFTHGYESGVRLRRGKVELLNEAQPRTLSLRLYKDKRGAVVYTSDLGREALAKLVNQALDLATVADADPAAGLPDPADLAKNFDLNLDIYDPSLGDLPTEIKVALIRRCEDAAFAYDPRINNTEGTSFNTRLREVGLVNSVGFAGSYRASSCSMSLDAVVDDVGGKKQSGWWFANSRHFKSLKKPEEVGRIAAERAIQKLGGRKVATKKVPVIWEPLMATELLGTLESAFYGTAFEQRATFLIPFEGKKLGSALLNIVDDPLRPGLPASKPFDGEGVATRRNQIFSEGVFERFLFNTYTARKTGRQTTGSAYAMPGNLPTVGSTNLYIEPGKTSREEMIAGVKDGLLLTEMIGHGYNPVTGDFSRGAVGIWIENGELTHAVSEINVAGNFKEMLANVTGVGNDLEFLFGTASPTLRIDDVTVSGL